MDRLHLKGFSGSSQFIRCRLERAVGPVLVVFSRFFVVTCVSLSTPLPSATRALAALNRASLRVPCRAAAESLVGNLGLETGEVPDGNVACVTQDMAAQACALAEAHGILTKCALVVADGLVDEEKGDAPAAWPVKWCRVVGGRWKLFRVCPLAAELPTWPTEPRCATIKNIPEKDALTGFRVVFCKEFLPLSDLWPSKDSLICCLRASLKVFLLGRMGGTPTRAAMRKPWRGSSRYPLRMSLRFCSVAGGGMASFRKAPSSRHPRSRPNQVDPAR